MFGLLELDEKSTSCAMTEDCVPVHIDFISDKESALDGQDPPRDVPSLVLKRVLRMSGNRSNELSNSQHYK